MTAVTWLINELIFKSEYEHVPNNYFLMSDKNIDKIIQRAKDIEMQDIMRAYSDGCSSVFSDNYVSPQTYYNNISNEKKQTNETNQ